MVAKQLVFDDDARQRILAGVQKLARAVRVTLGPRGRTVILQRDYGPPQIVNSGVLVAKALELEDPFENMGASLLREVAARNAATREYGDLLAMGVMDPAKVTRLALQNASSIAGLILTTACVIANVPEPKGAAAGMQGLAGGSPEF